MKKTIKIVLVIALIITVVVETSLLITGKLNTVPKLKNGEETIVEFKDGTKYSVDEIYNELKTSYGLNILLNKIDAKILEEEYKDKEEDIKSYVQTAELSLKSNYTDENGNYDEEKLLSALSNYGYADLDAYLETVRSGYLQDLAAKDYAKTLITDSEIKESYKNDIKADLNAVHVLVKPTDDSAQAEAVAKAKAEDIIKNINKEVKAGKTLEEAFKAYDSDEDDATMYQDLGTFNHGDMVEEFEKAAYALKAGQMSKTPVKTSYGYHVILVTKVAEKKSLEDSKDKILTDLAEAKIKEDSTIAVTAMDKLRTSYGVKFNDSELKNRYERYINYQLNNK